MPARQLHKTYTGRRNKHGRCIVHVIDQNGDSSLLPKRIDLYKYTPDGHFEWGYTGRGPAQLALAILADNLSDEIAIACHHKFRAKVVARLEHNAWILKGQDVVKFVMGMMVPVQLDDNGEKEK